MPQSSILRVLLLYAVAFSLLIAAAGFGVYFLVSSSLDRQARVEIDAELDQIVNLRRLNEQRERLLELKQLHPGAPATSHLYLLVDPGGACAAEGREQRFVCPVGNLESWPAAQPDARGWIVFTTGESVGGGAPAIARTLRLNTGYRLLVGRTMGQSEDLLAGLRVAIGVSAVIALFAAVAGGWLASVWYQRRIERINATLEAVGAGDMTRRVAMTAPNDELTALAGEVDEALDRIGALIGALRTTTSQAAHELRKPLARLLVKLETLLDRPQGDDAQRKLREAIGNARGLNELLSAILEIARVEARQRSEFARLDLREVVEQAVELHEPDAERRGIALTYELPELPVAGDPHLLLQLVTNLLRNAIKFTPEGGTVAIVGRAGETGPVLAVSDSGPGIPEAERDKVFDHFYRSGRTSAVPGSGLGLPLVAAIARRHDIAIELADAGASPGPGLRVTLRFPAAKI